MKSQDSSNYNNLQNWIFFTVFNRNVQVLCLEKIKNISKFLFLSETVKNCIEYEIREINVNNELTNWNLFKPK